MTATQKELFWNEVDLIQQRHTLFFHKDQIQNILITEIDSITHLNFSPGYNLDDIITSEIKLAFKLVQV